MPTRFAAGRDDGPRRRSRRTRNDDRRTGSTALIQPVGRDIVSGAANGPGVEESVNDLGEDVMTAFRPIEDDGVDWTVVAEVGRGELNQPIESYARNMLFAIALFVVAVTFIVVPGRTA